MKSVSIVIPVFNEERYIKPQIRALIRRIARMASPPRYEILLVENGSCDRTLSRAYELAEEFSYVRVLSLTSPSYGEAFKKGVRMARNDIVIQFDLDFWSVKFLRKALSMIDRYDMVIGSKNLEGSVNKRPMLRHFVSKFIEHSIRIRFNVPMTDTHGMKAIARDKLLSVIDTVKCPNHFLDTEILIRLFFDGCTYTEVPIWFEELRQSRFSFLKRACQVMIEYVVLMVLMLPRYNARIASRASYV